MNKIYYFFILNFIISISSYGQWEKIDYSFPIHINDINYQRGQILIASDSGIHYQSLGKTDWLVYNETFGIPYQNKIKNFTQLGERIVVTSDSGIYRKNQNGFWEKVNNTSPIKILTNQYDLLCYGYGTNAHDIYTSSDTGRTWLLNNPPNMSLISGFASNNTETYVGYTGDYIGLFKYSNKNWSEIPYFHLTPIGSVAVKDSLVAAIFMKAEDSIAFSSDHAKTWKTFKLPTYLQNYGNILHIVDSNLIITRASGAFISYDKGENWTKINSGLNQDTSITALEVVDDYLYAGTNNNTFDNYLYKRKLSDFQGITHSGQGQLEAPTVLNANYEWYLNENLLPESTSSIKALQNGVYKVIISYDTKNMRVSELKSLTYSYTINDIITGSEQLANNDKIEIKNLHGDIYVENILQNDATITVMDVCGKTIFNSNYVENGRINLSNQKQGIYIVKVQSGKIIVTKKVIL